MKFVVALGSIKNNGTLALLYIRKKNYLIKCKYLVFVITFGYVAVYV